MACALRAGLPELGQGAYALVLANILATPLKLLAPLLCGTSRRVRRWCWPASWSGRPTNCRPPTRPGCDMPSCVRRAERLQRWQQPARARRAGGRWCCPAASPAWSAAEALLWRIPTTWPPRAFRRHRPVLLQALCRLLRLQRAGIAACHRQLLAVESSGLVRAGEVSSLYKLQLVALRNRADIAVMMPALDLALTDTQGQPVARKVLFDGRTRRCPPRSAPTGLAAELARCRPLVSGGDRAGWPATPWNSSTPDPDLPAPGTPPSPAAMSALICGSLAFDTITNFPGRFSQQILPDQVHILNVSFLVPTLRREFGGCAGNIAYTCRRWAASRW
jgi:hypothetical protein